MTSRRANIMAVVSPRKQHTITGIVVSGGQLQAVLLDDGSELAGVLRMLPHRLSDGTNTVMIQVAGTPTVYQQTAPSVDQQEQAKLAMANAVGKQQHLDG